jgi:hypothetical protein
LPLYCKIMGNMSPRACLSPGTAPACLLAQRLPLAVAVLGSERREHSTARLATWSVFGIFAPALQTQFVTMCKGSTLVFLIYLSMRRLLKSKIKKQRQKRFTFCHLQIKTKCVGITTAAPTLTLYCSPHRAPCYFTFLARTRNLRSNCNRSSFTFRLNAVISVLVSDISSSTCTHNNVTF